MIRLAVRGFVDGALSSLGVVIGAAISNNPIIILSAGLSGATANGLSNILAAFTGEKIGRYIEFRNVEKKMLKSLKGTHVEKRIGKKVWKLGVIDGVMSIIGGVIPVIPFLFLQVNTALYTSITIVTVFSAILGIITGYFSKENMIWSAVKMSLFTLATAGICALVLNLI